MIRPLLLPLLLGAGLALASPAFAQAPAGAAPKIEQPVPAQPAPAQTTPVQATPPTAAPAAATPGMVPALAPENLLHLDLSTGGRVTVLLRPDAAPAHVERVKTLVRRGFYDGLLFHRVIDGFMAQVGDPQGTGQGGSDLPDLKAEFNELPHVRGTMSMARTQDPNSANSQFFLMFQPLLRLDRTYTVLGRVVAGMQWVDLIERGEPPANPSRILQASIGSDNKPPPVFAARPAAVDPVAAEAAKLLPPKP
jgi:peptidylprolyl isomerase